MYKTNSDMIKKDSDKFRKYSEYLTAEKVFYLPDVKNMTPNIAF